MNKILIVSLVLVLFLFVVAFAASTVRAQGDAWDIGPYEFTKCESDDDCPTDTTCRDYYCDIPGTETCKYYSINEDGYCDDDNLCTLDDGTCQSGNCIATPVTCDDTVDCTVDTCEPSTGDCVATPDNDLCDDADQCTEDICLAAGCDFSTPVVCTDGYDCTDDTCNPSTGCQSTPNDATCIAPKECDPTTPPIDTTGCVLVASCGTETTCEQYASSIEGCLQDPCGLGSCFWDGTSCITRVDLVAHWKLDENLDDASGKGHDGSCTNCPTPVTEGNVDEAYEFSGGRQDTYIVIPHDDDLNPTTEMAVTAWVYLDESREYHAVITKDQPDISYWFGTSDEKPVLFVSDDGSTFTTCSADSAISTGTWHHIAFTYEGGSVQFYTDGSPNGNPVPFSGPIYLSTSDVWIGDSSRWGENNDNALDGKIDDLRVFNRALTAAEIQEIYSGEPSFCTDGDTQPCGIGEGICAQGTMTCVGGTWGDCTSGVSPCGGTWENPVTPCQEDCTNSLDDNCDGQVNEGCACIENWVCSDWSVCVNDARTRTCTDQNSCGTELDKPETTTGCCIEDWSCGDWGPCINGTQTKTCTDANSCGTVTEKPTTDRTCTEAYDMTTFWILMAVATTFIMLTILVARLIEKKHKRTLLR